LHNIQLEKQQSDFSRYKRGYTDGYGGHDATLPLDQTYMSGYNDGNIDDQFGMPSKFVEDDKNET
tara:strand:- start:289 stop:483 length:195 start_codon:yes stop_codon:yes gene_type:complete